MSCTPQYLSALLNTGSTCATNGLLDATLAQCVAMRGIDGGGAPFWNNEANVGSTSSLANWPCGCFLYQAGNARRLYYNVDAACGTGNDYRSYDGCGCAAVTDSPPPPSPPPPHDCSACGGMCAGGIGIYSSLHGGCTTPSEANYCVNPADGTFPVSYCQPASPPPPSPSPPPPPSPPPSPLPPVSRGPSCSNQLLSQQWVASTVGGIDCDAVCATEGRVCDASAVLPTSEQCMDELATSLGITCTSFAQGSSHTTINPWYNVAHSN